MKSASVSRRQARLDSVFAKVASLPAGDIELQSHWARYLCILVSGFMEASVREIYAEYAANKASPNVANYVADALKRFQNPNMERILQVTGAFSKSWEDDLRRATEGDLRDAVDSIVAVRHQIAHGESGGITVVRMKEYYARCLKILQMIDAHCS